MNLVPYYDFKTDTYYLRAWIRDAGEKFMAFYAVDKELYDQVKAISDKAESDMDKFLFTKDDPPIFADTGYRIEDN